MWRCACQMWKFMYTMLWTETLTFLVCSRSKVMYPYWLNPCPISESYMYMYMYIYINVNLLIYSHDRMLASLDSNLSHYHCRVSLYECLDVIIYIVHVHVCGHLNAMSCMALGVLCCFALFVCLTLLASFFLPSHLSFKNMYTVHVHVNVHAHACTCTCTCMYMYMYIYINVNLLIYSHDRMLASLDSNLSHYHCRVSLYECLDVTIYIVHVCGHLY